MAAGSGQTFTINSNDFRESKSYDIKDDLDSNTINARSNYWFGKAPKLYGAAVSTDTSAALSESICSSKFTSPCCAQNQFDQEMDCLSSCSTSQGFYGF
jgi:hypothetical protein